MKNFLKVILIPTCGLILGLASLGNLSKDYHHVALDNLTGGISMILMVLIFVRLFILFEYIGQTLHDPIIASVSPTFTMSLMVIYIYFISYESIVPIAKFIWLCAVIFQVILVLYFDYHHVIKADLSIEAIYPSWPIIYVGLGVITITAGNFSPLIGKIPFWISLICYAFLLPIIIEYVFFVRNMAHPARPLVTIAAAPGSLCLTGYLKSFAEPNFYLVVALFALSQVLYFVVLSMLPRLFKLRFYPSYTAFTFSLVISAIAILTTVHYFNSLGIYSSVLDLLKVAGCLSASVAVFYVLARYVRFLVKKHSKHEKFVFKKIA